MASEAHWRAAIVAKLGHIHNQLNELEQLVLAPCYQGEPHRSSPDDTDQLVASVCGGQSPPAQSKTSPVATKPASEIDIDELIKGIV